MKTIKKNAESQIIISKSKFIGLLININDIDEVKILLDDIKIKYPNATHYCYAYIIDNNMKASDDGEPTGTAGLPILNVLTKENLTNVLCIIIRYYGGIKLGAPGLIRAYTKSATTTLKNATLGKLISGFEVTITFNYDTVKTVDYILKNAYIIDSIYDEAITYTFKISEDEFYLIENELKQLINTIYINKNIFIFQ